MGFARFGGGGLDHIGVDGALSEKFNIFYFVRLFIKDFDKGVAYNLAFFLRITDAY